MKNTQFPSVKRDINCKIPGGFYAGFPEDKDKEDKNSSQKSQIPGVFSTFLMRKPGFPGFLGGIFKFKVDSRFSRISRSPNYHDYLIVSKIGKSYA